MNYVIDVAEYSDGIDGILKKIEYFQLKHTTVRKKQSFTISELKDTFEGFGEAVLGLSESEQAG